MRGTGSHDIMVEDIFVPHHMTTPLAPIFNAESGAAERHESTNYDFPAMPFLSFAASLSAIGAAKEAVAAIAKRLAVHKWIGETVAQVEKPLSQARLAKADLLARTGELLIRQAAQEMPGYRSLSVAEQLAARLRWRAQIAEGLHRCHEAITTACASAGSSLHFLDNPLQRLMRDVAVQSTHVGFDIDAALEQYGRNLVGLPPTAVLF
ncbi:hypothetical protein [Sphingomonas sp. SRS2]|uniref:hypothetical protein n=1 Tax=Sphingomonas sp. SRS2 TaxID=133190 RepID=UPI001F309931|nr:hypothetical protein [Sphingomonas sp. SRS2]